ncbi:hypothetical protein C8N42_105228 [Celeribacter persicus]|jgi:hypothetical protein|uniref:Uncharacterized protein n=1 Tax=Celeribacter persicus TaxID=1651082 RepID=A0A2T5HPQ1_9RHOB|nr:hypothetical protein C8N42_105228 [Celeribacter persicus]
MLLRRAFSNVERGISRYLRGAVAQAEWVSGAAGIDQYRDAYWIGAPALESSVPALKTGVFTRHF